MARTSLENLDSIAKPDQFDDTRDAPSIAGAEAVDADYAEHNDAKLSQLKRILFGNAAGNWFDDPTTLGPGGFPDASLKALAARIGTGGGGTPSEQDFTAVDEVYVEHLKGQRPLVQVLFETIIDGWNAIGWNDSVRWNIGGAAHEKIPAGEEGWNNVVDKVYRIRHTSPNGFLLTFDKLETGKVVFI